jgi:hypothetical protein
LSVASGVITLSEASECRRAISKSFGIVRRRDLDRSGPELRVHLEIAAITGMRPAHERQLDLGADQVCVPLVLRVHGDRDVAQHRLRPRGRDREIRPAIRQARQRSAVDSRRERISQVVELPLHLLGLRFLVGERGQAARAPVDDVVAAIDEPLLVQRDEDVADGFGKALVEREPGTLPVARAAEPAQLLHDGALRLAT